MSHDNTETQKIQALLRQVVQRCEDEDRSVRETQIRTWRKLKLLWEGFSNIYWSDVAHDWRVYNQEVDSNPDNSNQGAYDRPVNVLRAYLESIIAALSVIVPAIKCFPDDADNPLDLATAKCGDKIAELIGRHNDQALIWLHALFILVTEHTVFCYSYPVSSEEYGTYEEDKYDYSEIENVVSTCPECGYEMDSEEVTGLSEEQIRAQMDKYGVNDDDASLDSLINKGEICPACMQEVTPITTRDKFPVSRIVGKTSNPKTRICMEVYGGLNIKIPNYARNQVECPYLIYSFETNYVTIIQEYEHLHKNKDFIKKLRNSSGSSTLGAYNDYGQWGRNNPQYQSAYPENVITKKQVWLRPAAFNFLSEEDSKVLKRRFPDGCKVVYADDEFCEACNERLDDYWTISHDPMADYLHANPLGLGLVSTQEITNDLMSLIIQTIEHGITQTFADPKVLDFNAYMQTEVTPGGVFPATPRTGKSLNEAFYEMRTATLSQEVMPFFQQVQSTGQLVSGALPSIFGGALSGSETASEYSMSRAQAQQRLQNNWKVFTAWWKHIFSKVIPMYIKEVQYDERFVQRNDDGSFINVFIKRSELYGKIGQIELESNENLPISWSQRNDTIMKMLQNTNPEIMSLLNAPENLPLIHEALGLPDMYMPGEDDVLKQYDEIKQLLASEPIMTGPEPDNPEGGELPSVEIDPEFDNHQIQFEICRKWIISEAGRQAKIDNPEGYKNVLLHGKMHQMMVQQAQMQAQMTQAAGAPPDGSSKTPNKREVQTEKEAPILGEGDVSTT